MKIKPVLDKHGNAVAVDLRLDGEDAERLAMVLMYARDLAYEDDKPTRKFIAQLDGVIHGLNGDVETHIESDQKDYLAAYQATLKKFERQAP